MNKMLYSLPKETVGRTRLSYLALATVLLIGIAGHSVAQSGPPPGGGRKGPPPEALAACKGLSVADACKMTMRRDNKTVPGQCIQTPDEQLACLPEGAPPPKG